MALIPYLLDEFRSRQLHEHLFELSELLDRPKLSQYLRPWRNQAATARDVGSTIKFDKNKFQVNLDVQHFEPEEITVKTSEGYVVIEGQHEERKDAHGFVSRHFKRLYALPEGCSPDAVESRLSSDGVLTVTAPITSKNSDERAVPITHTGPVRRKLCEDQANGDEQPIEKPPEKKRRR